jgi:signal peptidase I
MSKPDTDHLAALLRDSLQNGRQPQLTVTSNSMAPLIRAGDLIVIAAAGANLQPGDIITFENSSGLLTHRFWGFLSGNDHDRPLLITRGDKPLWFDPPLEPANVVGRICARQRGKQMLNLETGRGKWLNHHLAWLAAFENRGIISKVLLNGDAMVQPQKTDIPLGKRLVHWALYSWAVAVTAVIDLVCKLSIIG